LAAPVLGSVRLIGDHPSLAMRAGHAALGSHYCAAQQRFLQGRKTHLCPHKIFTKQALTNKDL
jgi:hypothetical protein